MVKRSKPGVELVKGQVTWSRYGGPKKAWSEAKKRAGLIVPTSGATA